MPALQVERTLEIDELSRGTMFMQRKLVPYHSLPNSPLSEQEVDIGLVILEAVELMRYAEDKNGVPVRKASVELVVAPLIIELIEISADS